MTRSAPIAHFLWALGLLKLVTPPLFDVPIPDVPVSDVAGIDLLPQREPQPEAPASARGGDASEDRPHF